MINNDGSKFALIRRTNPNIWQNKIIISFCKPIIEQINEGMIFCKRIKWKEPMKFKQLSESHSKRFSSCRTNFIGSLPFPRIRQRTSRFRGDPSILNQNRTELNSVLEQIGNIGERLPIQSPSSGFLRIWGKRLLRKRREILLARVRSDGGELHWRRWRIGIGLGENRIWMGGGDWGEGMVMGL